jgi:hypothetical protein
LSGVRGKSLKEKEKKGVEKARVQRRPAPVRVVSAEVEGDQVVVTLGETLLRLSEVEAERLWERIDGALIEVSRSPRAGTVILCVDLSGGGSWATPVFLSEAAILAEEIGRALVELERGDAAEEARAVSGFVTVGEVML